MKIGDIVTETPTVDSVDGIAAEDRGPRKGVVIYIHPQRRFYRVRFTTPLGYTWTECFYFPERRGNPRASMKIEPGSLRPYHRTLFRDSDCGEKKARYAY